jgi:hypothetical protein
MARKYFMWVFVAFILFCLASTTRAWDGQRKGFILGFGLGSGVVSFDETKYSSWMNGFPEEVYRTPVIVDVKIGYAPDNSLQVYWTGKSSFFKTSHYRYGMKPYFGDYEVFYGVWGPGCSYFFKPEAPSPFIAAGIGYSAWQEQAWEAGTKPKAYYGLGLFVGGGFEFSRHWSLEMYLSLGKPGMEGLEVDTDELGVGTVLSLRVSVNVLGY